MSKRVRCQGYTEEPSSKRLRKPDLISPLSDELLLHILHFLPIRSLITCQWFAALAGDSELWKQKYYTRWVEPRALRVQQVIRNGRSRPQIRYTPRVSTWLDQSPLATINDKMHWKCQYRLQHNWSKGSCRTKEVEVAHHSIPPAVVKLCHGLVFTADIASGLRVWSANDTNSLLASVSYADIGLDTQKYGPPTAISAEFDDCDESRYDIVLGFERGVIAISSFGYEGETPKFRFRLFIPTPDNGAISSIACHEGYLLVFSGTKILSLYQLNKKAEGNGDDPPRLITSLTSSTIQMPVSLSIRTTLTDIIMSIAYTFPRIGCGWSFGIQEFRCNKSSEKIECRLATTVAAQFSDQAFHCPFRPGTGSRKPAPGLNAGLLSMYMPTLAYTQRPTFISYSHPYLLTSHADNTLTMYLVVSNADNLRVKLGYRLWGHTSAVAGVQVSSRGKAVSVSPKTGQIRLWELEDIVSTRPTHRRVSMENHSILINSHPSNIQAGRPGFQLLSETYEVPDSGTAIEFDDRQIVILRGRDTDAQVLNCYDFT
ncbi:hypothetical protein FQN57_005591 [Myotisia sp. PD_48]|nr:hypothetical protein FQN57_005591 [Myotisia sp. PD_48]